MKIAFLCGSCEPGANGVGDYTVGLAQALAECGHHCMVIALHDPPVDHPSHGWIQSGSGDSFACLRLPPSLPWRERARILAAELKRFGPDWISLQFVPYAFHPRGLPFGLFSGLWPVRTLARWHLMAHELWVDPDASLKNRYTAAIQKRLLRFLAACLRPSAIHTSNPFYVEQLASIGQRAQVLPLFSSISVQSGLPQKRAKHNHWTLIFFGSIHPEWNPQLLLVVLEQVASICGITSLAFVSIGGAGSHGRALWAKLADTTPAWIHFTQLGPQPSSEISAHLQQADFGITTTPSHLLGKSASVAAMLAHGLQVIVPRVERTYGSWHQALHADERFLLLDSRFNDRLIQAHVRAQAPHLNAFIDSPADGAYRQLGATRDQFVQTLNAAA